MITLNKDNTLWLYTPGLAWWAVLHPTLGVLARVRSQRLPLPSAPAQSSVQRAEPGRREGPPPYPAAEQREHGGSVWWQPPEWRYPSALPSGDGALHWSHRVISGPRDAVVPQVRVIRQSVWSQKQISRSCCADSSHGVRQHHTVLPQVSLWNTVTLFARKVCPWPSADLAWCVYGLLL